MLCFKTNFKSIFDVIEESEPCQVMHVWKNIDKEFQISDSQIIYKLFTKNPDSSLEEGAYTLMPFMLIRTIQSSSQCINLKNSRIAKINDSTKRLFGIRISGYKGQDEIYSTTPDVQKALFEQLKKYCTLYHLMNEFNLIKIIGRGNFSKVHLANRLGSNGKCAIKSIEKNKILENIRNMRSLTKEIEILRKIEHSGVIKLYEIYEDETHVHLILEYLKGGEVFQHIKNKGMYEESDAMLLMKELLSAIEYIHKINIIHRDLKPENLILSDTTDDAHVKIADFGLATISSSTELEHLKCGSPGYVAPEVLLGPGYSTKADIFSAGIILYTILTGVSPFYGKSQQEVLQKNKACSIEFSDKHWSGVSLPARNLVERMTEKNPYKRLNATECLQHQWFKSPLIPHFGSLLAAQENIKLMQPSNFKDKTDSSMLTCTPVMSGRNSEDKPSPFLNSRPFVFPSDLQSKNQTDSKGSKTPTAVFDNFNFTKLSTPFDEYLKKLSGKVELQKEKEEDFKNDMDEIGNGITSAFKPLKMLSQKCLPVTPGFDKKFPIGFSFVKQNTQTLSHNQEIDDKDIIASNDSMETRKAVKPPAVGNNVNPFLNPFFMQKEESQVDKAVLKTFLNDIK